MSLADSMETPVTQTSDQQNMYLNKNVRDRVKYLHDTGLWCDCSLMVGNDENKKLFHAHKWVLAMSSPVFGAMFFGEIQEYDYPIKVTDIKPDAFGILLNYMYSDCCMEISSFELAYEVLYAAKKYLVTDVVIISVDHLIKYLQPDNACRAYEISKLFDEEKLRKSSEEVLKNETEAVLEHSSFEDVELDTLLFILDNESLNIPSERVVFDAVYKWGLKECIRRELPKNEDSLRMVLKAAIGKIRFLSMTTFEFAEGPALTPLLNCSEKLALFMNILSKTKPVPIPVNFSEISDLRSRRPLEDYWTCDRKISSLSSIKIKSTCQWRMFEYCLSFSVDRSVYLKGFKMVLQTQISGQYSGRLLLSFDLLDSDNIRLAKKHIFHIFKSIPAYSDRPEKIFFDVPTRIHKNKIYRIEFVLPQPPEIDYEIQSCEIGEKRCSFNNDFHISFNFEELGQLKSVVTGIIFSR